MLNTFTHNKSFAYLLNIEQSNLVFLKTDSTEFDDITTPFIDQNDGLLETEGKVNLTLLIRNKI